MFSTVPGDEAQVDKDAEACSMCHGGATPLVRLDVSSRSRVYLGDDGTRKLAMRPDHDKWCGENIPIGQPVLRP